jgi:hypothetical protein
LLNLNQLSGGLPVFPESACIETCNAYGGACSGVYFDHSIKKCFLKGTHTGVWTFEQEEDNDGVDLVGGCALWSAVGESTGTFSDMFHVVRLVADDLASAV